ncbi:ATP-binding protein, partial [candidate division KSB1 bacterium]|nr:ATP-binding protein [candidate division KSB1 bacterium]
MGKKNDPKMGLIYIINKIEFSFQRKTQHYHFIDAFSDDIPFKAANLSQRSGNLFNSNHGVVDLTSLINTFKELSEILYIGPFRNVVNMGTNENYYDIQIGQSAIKAWGLLKTGNEKFKSERAYSVTKEIGRIFGLKDLEINSSFEHETFQFFIDGKSYKLSELGSGLAQFVIAFINVAIKNPTYILIDEPELNLHPSMQLDFVTSLASYSAYGVLFATHSLGLARSSSDQIYSVQLKDNNQSIVKPFESTPHYSEFLGELSFSEYQELGFD